MDKCQHLYIYQEPLLKLVQVTKKCIKCDKEEKEFITDDITEFEELMELIEDE